MKPRTLPPGIYLDKRNGKFVAKIKIDGKMSRAVSFVSLADAVEHLDELRDAAARPKEVKPKGITLGEWIDVWIDRRRKAGRHQDVDEDKKVLDRYVDDDLRKKPLRELKQRDLRAWLYELSHREAKTGGGKGKGKPLGRQTLANALNLLRGCVNEAVDAGKISTSPAVELKLPRAGGTTREHTGYLPVAEIDALLGQPNLPLRNRAIYTVAIYTGMRASELWGLRWENVILDGERPEVIVRFSGTKPTKGGQVRRVPLLAPARDALLAWRASHKVTPIAGVVWPTSKPGKTKNLVHRRGYDADWATWARENVGIEHAFKQLRHSCGCHLVMGTWGPPMSLIAVQNWLRHKSITTTERFYARYAPEGLHAHRAALDEAQKSSTSGSTAAKGRKDKTREP